MSGGYGPYLLIYRHNAQSKVDKMNKTVKVSIKIIFCNLRQDSNMLGHWDKEKAEIGGNHFKKWLPLCFDRHCHVETNIKLSGFLIYANTSLVTKLMILTQIEPETGGR